MLDPQVRDYTQAQEARLDPELLEFAVPRRRRDTRSEIDAALRANAAAVDNHADAFAGLLLVPDLA
ncbi:hypothetical protein ACFFJ4_17540 [Xanthomonas dyei]|uniref:hypothetical protein n=1 Tax=Xanthomonas dyei TaxID=743699 RepID=UPI001FD1E8BC|nr:hypothetical protein [Xanthomonas dyei]